MTPAPPLPQTVWDATPPEARALIAALLLQIESLRAEVAALKARLDANSSNSSRPPSTDPPHVKRQPPRPASKRRPGGQPGHKRSIRPMVPPEQLSQVVDCIPETCSCGAVLTGVDPVPHPHQVAELPEVRPDVIEYRLHRLVCSTCQKATRAPLPAGVPTGAFGPRLLASITLLASRSRQSKRLVQAVLADFWGLHVATGSVSKAERRATLATAAPVEEVATAIATAPALNVDETSWRQGVKRPWLWTAVSRGMTLFRIDPSRGAEALRRLVGESIAPVVTSDRFSTYKVVPRRQICWAHLRRDFQAMIDRRAGGRAVGERLLFYSDRLYGAWRKFAAGRTQRSTLRREVGWLRPAVRAVLKLGSDCCCSATASTCRELLTLEGSLWTFARVEGVSPDNNAAERALRHGVIWRKTSGGTASAAGSRYVAQMLTVVETCRQRGRNVLEFLTGCFRAVMAGQPAPSLLA